jgi:hypothetical protein
MMSISAEISSVKPLKKRRNSSTHIKYVYFKCVVFRIVNFNCLNDSFIKIYVANLITLQVEQMYFPNSLKYSTGILILGVCILLCVSDQVQFPSNATLFL